eukprot:maker-scaffold_31-snap-gene-1.3-mRNA-1 protein AED:0.38 eAED:0.38 QI:62/1/1/1/1/1/2/59/204
MCSTTEIRTLYLTKKQKLLEVCCFFPGGEMERNVEICMLILGAFVLHRMYRKSRNISRDKICTDIIVHPRFQSRQALLEKKYRSKLNSKQKKILLPEEILPSMIIEYLGYKELVAFGLACKKFSIFSLNDKLWRKLLFCDFSIDLDSLKYDQIKMKNVKEFYRELLRKRNEVWMEREILQHVSMFASELNIPSDIARNIILREF